MTGNWSNSTWRRHARSLEKKISFLKQRHWPKVHRIMLTAYELGERKGYANAVAWAERYASGRVRDGIHILRANRDKSNPHTWLAHLNAYLQQYDTSQVRLNDLPTERFLRLCPVRGKAINEGPLVSVIMCVYNAQGTIETAVRSILDQSWRRLEILLVDDCSTDSTRQILVRLAEEDPRIKLQFNSINVGPYVCRNLALLHAKGQYITCHDSDDWAHPSRLEKQLECVRRDSLFGCISGMLRMRADGHFVRPVRAQDGVTDGWLRPAFVSAFFEREAFDRHLRYWDSVRFGADTELMCRAELSFGNSMRFLPTVSMVCLEHENSLTNHPQTGISERDGLSRARRSYVREYRSWQKACASGDLRLAFPLHERPFDAPKAAVVPVEDVLSVLSKTKKDVDGSFGDRDL